MSGNSSDHSPTHHSLTHLLVLALTIPALPQQLDFRRAVEIAGVDTGGVRREHVLRRAVVVGPIPEDGRNAGRDNGGLAAAGDNHVSAQGAGPGRPRDLDAAPLKSVAGVGPVSDREG